jgi:hypothetical protein
MGGVGMDEHKKCDLLFREAVSNIHAGFIEVQRGAAVIVNDKTVFGKSQIEKGIAYAGLGICTFEKAILLGCITDRDKLHSLNRGLNDIKTGIDGLNIGMSNIPEFWSDNANLWLGNMLEILNGMLKMGNGHNIVLDIWGSL